MRRKPIARQLPSLKRPNVRGVMAVGSLGLTSMFVFPSIAEAAPTVPASGGTVTAQISAKDLTSCVWSSDPVVRGFGLKTKCRSVMTRVAHLPANPSTAAKEFVLMVRADGPAGARVLRMLVVENGKTR